MYSSAAFGDYPNWNADSDIKNPADRFTGWMLLSLGKDVTVSSTDSIYAAVNLSDESMRTFWSAKTGNPGEWLTMDLGDVKTVKAIQLNYYDHKTVQYNRANDVYYQYRIYASEDGKEWELRLHRIAVGFAHPLSEVGESARAVGQILPFGVPRVRHGRWQRSGGGEEADGEARQGRQP